MLVALGAPRLVSPGPCLPLPSHLSRCSCPEPLQAAPPPVPVPPGVSLAGGRFYRRSHGRLFPIFPSFPPSHPCHSGFRAMREASFLPFHPIPFPSKLPRGIPGRGGEGMGWEGGSAGSRRCWRGGSMPRLRGRPGSSSSSPGGVRESASGCVCVCGVCVCACAPGPPPPPCLPLAARQPGPGAGGGGGAPRAPGGSERPRGGGRRCPMPAGQP